MIGNGFDLEHNLPTRYADFLDFIKYFTYYEKYKHISESLYSKYIEDIFQNDELKNRVNALNAFTKNNVWIKYFNNIYRNHFHNKENWVDFESEIADIIQKIDKIKKIYEDEHEIKAKNNILNEIKKDLTIFEVFELNKKTIKEKIAVLLHDLNRLINALEVYIWDYIGNKEIEYYNPDIYKINPDKVFSFNYSDTYRRLYEFNKNDVEYSFTHGKATNNISEFLDMETLTDSLKQSCISQSIEKNNMVLGIDEYLDEERRDKEVDFIAFKKYYQRIYKKTGNEYKKWLKEITDNEKAGKTEENILYIFGHSLDETDGDILRECILHSNIKTVIYYKDKKQLGQQIANLVKVLKSDEVIERVYGSNPTIIFQEQCKRERINPNYFEIKSDIIKFKNIYKLSNLEVDSLIKKIRIRVKGRNLDYFYSQQAVIMLYDVIQLNGQGEKYGRDLLQIAYELIKCDVLREPEQYDVEAWSYFDNERNLATKIFIEKINTYNRNHFSVSEENVESIDIEFGEYQKLVNSEEKIDKDNYIKILNDIFTKFFDNNNYIQKAYDLLLKISTGQARNVAKDTLQELIETSDDDLYIIRYKHLLKEINRKTRTRIERKIFISDDEENGEWY